MVASPVNTTPRFKRRSASSRSDISSSRAALKLIIDSGIECPAGIYAAEAVGRPRTSHQPTVGRFGPAGLQALDLGDELRFVLATYQHADPQQRLRDRIRRQRLAVYVGGARAPHSPRV